MQENSVFIQSISFDCKKNERKYFQNNGKSPVSHLKGNEALLCYLEVKLNLMPKDSLLDKASS